MVELRAPRFWSEGGWQSRALQPLALAYGGLARGYRLLKPKVQAPLPLVCVGNYTAGGAGKTPVVRSLVEGLETRGHRPVVVSKGYGGRLKGPLWVDPLKHTAAEVGDEPLLLASDCPVMVARSRAQGMAFLRQELAKALPAHHDLIVMDDGLQNPSLRPDLAFAVVDAGTGIGNARTLPAGPLREPLALGFERSQAVIVLRTGQEADHPSLAAVMHQAQAQDLKLLHGHTYLQEAPARPWVLAFCGIARPAKFFRSLTEAGYRLTDTQPFGDHQPFPEAALGNLYRRARADEAQLVTTEKDWLRLPEVWRERVHFVRLHMEWERDQALDLIEVAIARWTQKRAANA